MQAAAAYVSDPLPDPEELRPFVERALRGTDPSLLTGYGRWKVAEDAARYYRAVLRGGRTLTDG